MVRGARVIELKQGESAVESNTWIRLVSGALLCPAMLQPHSYLLVCPAVLQPHTYLLGCGQMRASPGVFHLAAMPVGVYLAVHGGSRLVHCCQQPCCAASAAAGER